MNEPMELTVVMAEFFSLNGYLDAVSDALASGQMPDIRGFESRVAHICETIKTEDDTALLQKYREALGHLLSRLDICEQQMKAFHDAHNKVTTQ